MNNDMENINIQKAEEWLLHSGIQNPEGVTDISGNDVAGSFNAWFNPKTNDYAYVYIEISGYAITMLCYLYRETLDSQYLDAAKRVGDWLLRIQYPNGTFPTAVYTKLDAHKKPSAIHTFDVGMVINGLTVLYRDTKHEPYLESAKLAADWIVCLQREDGSIPANIDQETGKIRDTGSTWSTQSGSYHVKFAMGLLNVHELTGDSRYEVAARKLCEYALTKQKPDGQFITYGDLDGTNLHPHSYSAEGLYVAGKYLHEPRYLEAARKASIWSLSLQNDGVIPRHKHDERLNYNERVDIIAQTSRLAHLFDLNVSDRDLVLARLKEYQVLDTDDAKQIGGFRFGKSSTGESLPHVNAWVTMFALQALIFDVSEKEFSPFTLV